MSGAAERLAGTGEELVGLFTSMAFTCSSS
jgi:hypothetical protein